MLLDTDPGGIVIMGGAFHRGGNIAYHAESNIHFNSEAAQKVFASQNNLVVLPLDVTQKSYFYQRLGSRYQPSQFKKSDCSIYRRYL